MPTPVATLLPLTSLPNFAAAVDFVTWLKKTNQNGWQLLPMAEALKAPYRNQGIGLDPHFYDNHIPEDFRTWMLTREEFINKMRYWIHDYALFQALALELHTAQWWTWPEELRERKNNNLTAARLRLDSQINGFIDQQYFLYNELEHLRRHAVENEITLIADLPFYISRESALVWAHQNLFQLGEGGAMKLESGVPAATDEPFAEQYWGHPLYDWENNDMSEVMGLFRERLGFLRGFADLVRIDHANGFFKYGAMSREHPAWNRKLQGPGKPAVVELLRELQSLRFGVYFEDIASDKMRLEQFMKEYDLAGTGVVTLTYNVETTDPIPSQRVKDEDLDIRELAGNRIIFTSTHDTPTLLGWVKKLPAEIRTRVASINHIGTDSSDAQLAGALRDYLLTQQARMIVIPWQDWWLDEFRFNVPGHEELTNWHYPVDVKKYLARL